MVKVHSTWYNQLIAKKGSPIELLSPLEVELKIAIDERINKTMVMRFNSGFKTDGLSVPKLFHWFLKGWDDNNDLYNIAGVVHDWLYCSKGANCTFSREECDDIFRGILRESGISRFKAGIADKCVEWFAGGASHWGNDSYKVITKGTMWLK